MERWKKRPDSKELSWPPHTVIMILHSFVSYKGYSKCPVLLLVRKQFVCLGLWLSHVPAVFCDWSLFLFVQWSLSSLTSDSHISRVSRSSVRILNNNLRDSCAAGETWALLVQGTVAGIALLSLGMLVFGFCFALLFFLQDRNCVIALAVLKPGWPWTPRDPPSSASWN